MSLPIWSERPQEDAHLFNPAFCGALMVEFSVSYLNTKKTASLDLPLPFCALPISLHRETRNSLPSRTVTSLFTWLQRYPTAIVGYAERATNLAPYVKESVSFCVARDVMSFNEVGQLTLGSTKATFTPKFLEQTTIEVREIVLATRMIGRWFAGAGSTATILAAWGITL